jgi:phosphonoacetate hydrolase
MGRTAIIVCIDGCGPEYLHASSTPFMKRVGQAGVYRERQAMMPSVTNVNATSILTGTYPATHGITSNYYFERGTGREVFMESPDFIKTRTILEEGTRRGLTTALVTAKEKLKTLLARGTATAFSAEKPLPWVTRRLGPPPPIYSVDVNIWLLKALREVILREGPDLVYAQTTDYAMHKYAPEDAESKRHMEGLDRALQATMEAVDAKGDDVLLCITGDHGMSEITRAVNLELVLKKAGIPARLNTLIADRYVVHHRNLGGAAYLYLKHPEDAAKGLEVLNDTEGVEAALPREQASERYHLDRTRIGDLVVLGEKSYAFGLTERETAEVALRSHGSLHERRVPIIINRPASRLGARLHENKDVAAAAMTWLKG